MKSTDNLFCSSSYPIILFYIVISNVDLSEQMADRQLSSPIFNARVRLLQTSDLICTSSTQEALTWDRLFE